MRVTTFTRAMLHDPTVYPNPEEFVPGRFLKDGRLNPDVRDPLGIAFGFGRRLVQTVPSILSVRLICLFVFAQDMSWTLLCRCNSVRIHCVGPAYIEHHTADRRIRPANSYYTSSIQWTGLVSVFSTMHSCRSQNFVFQIP